MMARESQAARKVRATSIVRLLRKQYPDARCALNHRTVHQLMVATILSAQCTDERVNQVTPELFKRYASVGEFASAELPELERLIYTTGFFRAKAKSIQGSARAIVEHHGAEVPRTLAELVKLPGVGRKTASVILGVGFGLAEGIVVDTHVARISRLLNLTTFSDPVKIEQDLMKIIPQRDWIDFSHLMIWHGRSVCVARRPRCPICPIKRHCPSAMV